VEVRTGANLDAIQADAGHGRETPVMIRSLLAVSLAIFCMGCAGTMIVYPPTSDHAGALRVAEVMDVSPGHDLPEPRSRVLYQAGISQDALQAGSIAIGRTYCCGGSNETNNVLAIFVPAEVLVKPGDVLEVRMGREPTGDHTARVNTATRIREEYPPGGASRWGSEDRNWDDVSCKWIPEKPSHWGRLLYCDWMPEEGWIEYDGFWGAWIKPIE
jgi:hypothetical protein